VTEERNEETHHKILNAVTKLEVSKGHLKWKISDIAREADVTRSLIYYYLGKEKEVILEEAVKYMLDLIFNLFQDEPLRVKYRMKIALEQLREMPYLLVIYYLNRGQDNKIGGIIRDREQKLFGLLKSLYPQASYSEIMKLYLLELGVVVYQDVPEDFIDSIFPE
jgi:AcrR family transcriptional regulator